LIRRRGSNDSVDADGADVNGLPKRLGDYHLIKLVRVGLFTELWSADDLRSQRTYILEIIAPRYLADKAMARQLQADFEHSQEFDHPNVLQSYHLKTIDGIPFIVRDNFPAKTLRQMMLISKREVVLPQLHSVVSQIAAGLQHMHDRKWIHGNVNPSCVLVNERYEVKVTGLYSTHPFPQSKIASWFSSSHASGSLSYASPEQIQNEQVDPRSDVYSLGCILFELLESKTPYTGKSQQELLHKHVTAAIPRISNYPPNVPKQLGDLVYSMMRKNPRDRPESMLIVQHELNRLFDKKTEQAASSTPCGASLNYRASYAEIARSRFGLKLRPDRSAAVQGTVHSMGANVLSANQLLWNRHWKILLCMGATALLVGGYFSANAMQQSVETREAQYLELFRGFVEEMDSAPKQGSSSTNTKEWDELGERITIAVDKYSMEMAEGTSKRPDRLELGWAANLMPRAFVNRSGPMGRDDILKVVKTHLDNAETHKQKMASKLTKNWQRRKGMVQRWLESDVVFWSLLGLNFIGGAVLVSTFLRKRR